MGYFQETLKGITWMGLLRGSTRFLGFIRIAVLARLLSPVEFGVYGIATLVLAFLEILTETGINVFLVQDTGDLKEYINTAWIVSIARGFLISILLVILAGPISIFFNSPNSLGIIYFISIVPLLRGFINPSIVKFQKDLAFNKEFIFRFTIFAFDAIIAIFVALITKSALSLVWGLLTGVILEIILSFAFVKPTPKFVLELSKVKKVFSRGKWLTAAGVFNFLFHQGDDAVVGRLLDASSLGLYQLAYKISTLPITEAGEIFNKVTFPVYMRIMDDKKRLKFAFFRVMAMISVFSIPFGLMLFFFTKEIVIIALGIKWLSAVPAVKVLAIFGIIRSISGSTTPLFLAAKKQEYVTIVTLVSILGLAISIIPLVTRYGIVGAATSAIVGSVIALPFMTYYTVKVLGRK